MKRTETQILILALRQLADSIISTDGVANAAIAEAADRLQEQAVELRGLREHLKPRAARSAGPAPDLTEEQERHIRQAAEDAYDGLRWHTGDSRELLAALHRLARDSYLAGRTPTP